VFREAGDDVEIAWRDHLADPKHEGAPSVDTFLGFVAGQLPALAGELRRKIAFRTFALRALPELREDLRQASPAGDDDSADDDDSAAGDAAPRVSGVGAAPTIAAWALQDVDAPAWEVTLAPGEGSSEPPADVEWKAVVVTAAAWDAAADAQSRAALIGAPEPPPEEPAPESSATLVRPGDEPLVLAILAWGADGWSRTVRLAGAEKPPENTNSGATE
jgi:hypothetical protein